MRGEGVVRMELSATVVLAPKGGSGAAVAWGVSTGLASKTHRVGTEGTGLDAADPENREAGLSTTVAEEGV